MEAVQTVINRFYKIKDLPAIYWKNNEYSYEYLLSMIDEWVVELKNSSINQGAVCGFIGDYSPQVCSLIFALMKIKAIIVPLSVEVETSKIESFKKIAAVEFLISFDSQGNSRIQRIQNNAKNRLINDFLERNHPGLVVFTSGSTGEPKGILHDCELVMSKFINERKGWKTILFLLIDHFGGFNTLLSSFAYGGTAICIPNRYPETICQIIEKTKTTLLPTTPTFINLLIVSRIYQKYDLSYLKLITYGTEVMPESTLKKLKDIFPNAKIKQTYGLSELGVLRSKSKADDSVWVKVGGKGFETKIIDGYLWVRSHSNMVGYLNAPNPIDEEGWMNTGDQVEERGNYIRILGRKSEMINVGGEKVYPQEVENVIQELDNVSEVMVYGEKNPVMGNIICAKVRLLKDENKNNFTVRLRKYCRGKLQNFKVPVKVSIIDEELHSARFKKNR